MAKADLPTSHKVEEVRLARFHVEGPAAVRSRYKWVWMAGRGSLSSAPLNRKSTGCWFSSLSRPHIDKAIMCPMICHEARDPKSEDVKGQGQRAEYLSCGSSA